MRLMTAVAGLAMVFASLTLPASARDEYVNDGGALFKPATVSSLNQTIGDFHRTTGKEVVVWTVPSLGGSTVADAAEKTFSQQQVNGVLIFLSKSDKKVELIPDRASSAFFPNGTLASVHQAMRGYFRTGDYDQGITTGVNLVIDQYRSHERALPGTVHRTSYAPSTSSFGGGMSLFWIILILIAGFLIIRGIFRAIAGPRMMPPGYGGGPGYGGPGYGGGGYGGGGFGGGGGGFFSGLLGGLGGAFIGNELFGRHDGGGYNDAGIVGGGDGGGQDSTGWQSDPGQADMGNAAGGDFGGGDGGGFGGDGGGGDGGGW